GLSRGRPGTGLFFSVGIDGRGSHAGAQRQDSAATSSRPIVANRRNPSESPIRKHLGKVLRRVLILATIAARRRIADGRPRPAVPSARRLGNSSMVEQRTLTPLILVRIQVPQPILPKSLICQ